MGQPLSKQLYTQLVGLVLYVTEKASLHVHGVVLLYSYPRHLPICLSPPQGIYLPTSLGNFVLVGLGDWALLKLADA